ncbi:CRISPR-associated protein, Cas2 family [Desulfacinum hydrothermale DSM 13146]|uniref:CRISPR-associated endoribonuclease Cas2 n=1 Tax=Desulfacinum hydrothermale DSM 13146 TaxID=1121390 RepID=A0A1W1XVQ3_9BACT|nr:CRISPR-associated endonuclease Cas2 [Desulfacinum hydrothermale]SMC27932.1 CRISPR-associated protein, Cas2 family [Desulfacinum hydrothermale DSM 13146]
MEHLYLVCYDIRDDKRWRRLYKAMKGYGEWLQLSVFQCRLDRIRRLRMEETLRTIVNQDEDHVLIMDLGPAEGVQMKVQSLGKEYRVVERRPVIV